MNINFRTLATICAVAMSITGCSDNKNPGDSSEVSAVTSTGETEETVQTVDAVTDSGVTPEECNAVDITFSESGISVENNGAQISGNTVTISKGGVYCLSGESADAKIVIDADKENDEVTLLFSGVNLKSTSGSVIDCESAKTFTLTFAENTENFITDTENYTFEEGEDEPDGAIFSRSDTLIDGMGKLTVSANYKDGIKCKDGLYISGGVLDITSVDDGITGKDCVEIEAGDITVVSGGDGIKSSNDSDEAKGYITLSGGKVNINAQKDGIQAETKLTVSGGVITAKTGGDAADADISSNENMKSGNPFDWDISSENAVSMKGLKAGGDIEISGGEFFITSADDSVHSNANIKISGGEFTLSSCDDGIHADEGLVIEDGTIIVSKSYEGLEGKNIEISGGTIDVISTDDGLNAAGGDNGEFFGFNSNTDEYYICISGGNITVNASGDGIDSNGTIAQSGGIVVVYGPTSDGDGALDYEKSFAVSGGTLIALGSKGMAQAPSTLSQPCISINADVDAGTEVSVKDADGNVILSTTTPKQCSSLIFSSDKLTAGNDYNVYAGSEVLSTVTAENGVVGNGATGQQGGMGGFGGGGRGGRGDRGDMGTPPDRPSDTLGMGGFASLAGAY